MTHRTPADDLTDRKHFNVHGLHGTYTQVGDVASITFNDPPRKGWIPGPGYITLERGFVTLLQLPKCRGGAVLYRNPLSDKKLSDFNF